MSEPKPAGEQSLQPRAAGTMKTACLGVSVVSHSYGEETIAIYNSVKGIYENIPNYCTLRPTSYIVLDSPHHDHVECPAIDPHIMFLLP